MRYLIFLNKRSLTSNLASPILAVSPPEEQKKHTKSHNKTNCFREGGKTEALTVASHGYIHTHTHTYTNTVRDKHVVQLSLLFCLNA